MGLDTVPFLVIIGQVHQLQGQVCPDALQSCWVQSSNVDDYILQAQHMCCVVALQNLIIGKWSPLIHIIIMWVYV